MLQQAMALQQQGRLREAERLYRAVLDRDRNHFASLYGLAVIRSQLGDFDDAVRLMRRALNQNPRLAGAHNDLGGMLEAAGRHEEAIERYRRALALDPGFAAAETNLGRALHALGRCEEAVAHHRRALALKPDFADAHNNLGAALHALGRHEEAVAHFERAVALEPGFAQAHNNLGNAMRTLRRHEDALRHYRTALALWPNYAEAHYNAGNALQTLGRHDEAIAPYEKAAAIRPGYAEALNNLGNALQMLNRHDEAIARFEQALAAKPDYAEALNNLGNSLQALNRHEQAIPLHARALALQPDCIAAQWNEGLARLVTGDFKMGWEQYEGRWAVEGPGQRRRDFAQPQWRGEAALAGRTILLHAEQGLGDTLHFARYVPMVAALGASVVLEVQKPLVPLLAGLAGVTRILAQGEALPPFDCHSPLLSLPLAFGTTLDIIPRDVPYLAAAPDRIAAWRATVEATAPPRIGVVWAGSAANLFDRRRTIPLRHLLPLLATPGIKFFALQKDLRPGDLELLRERPEVTVLSERLGDFADTAAAVSLLDLVISVDTAVAHLAGALARPFFLLLPFSAEWRWLRGREDSPWYPTARLFRQPAIGDWDSVVASVRDALGAFLAAR
ncbi:MAG TPA: tetratricopeptide repeat protein [Stellaceae bacterium]|nr:tetratricopeptide repeat protein [Stellaceae bacterium]